MKTSTWLALSVVLVGSIWVNLWSKNNRETALVSNPDTTTIIYNSGSDSTEDKPDSKAKNSKYQPVWNEFKILSTGELVEEYIILSNPKKIYQSVKPTNLRSVTLEATKYILKLLQVGFVFIHKVDMEVLLSLDLWQ